MNLIELYDELIIPSTTGDVFTAVPIPEFPQFRVAINSEESPIILLSINDPIKDVSLKNFRLKHLQLQQNINCKIIEDEKVSFQIFTVITFTNSDRNLQEYFFKISETLIKTIGGNPTQQQLISSLNKFVEVFRALTDVPKKTVQGLWAELFFIENGTDSSTLLNYWHQIPEEKFDFNAGKEKVEVKSNTNFDRIHIFSSEQLNPPQETQVLIASIFVRQNTNGKSIQELVNNITNKLKNDFELIDKLNSIVCNTLGNTIEQSIMMKFDYGIAKDSLLFYKHQDIPKIEELNIPNQVSEVKYKSDLSWVTSIFWGATGLGE
ncbi:PD-(D/E)XK motif protein [uncultured Cytophaga sp.]|uniref:PD-(D/E)XK motif protein n=1 Tax=uncultured Cytophaga sp. TaxID=160238 RepID=UPI00261ED3CD|nr:PD-(D/E)XK motif protein [uncultured Cytophaga sp.]